MKILHITAQALRGGCEKNCYHFIGGSPAHHHDLIVLDRPGPMSEDWAQQGIKVQHADILSQHLFRFRTSLARLVEGRHYDLVICWSSIRLPFQLNALNGVTGQIRVYLGNPVDGRYSPLKDIVTGRIFTSRANVKLMACSQYVRSSHLNTAYYKDFDIGVSLNPVDVPVALPAKDRKPGRIRLGMVARLDPIKDHRTVILAFRAIHREMPETELHFVGAGMLRDSLERLVEEQGLKSAVTFHGDVKDVYHYLNQWEVFIYATTPQEGLGSVVEEAMANGLPVVLSDLPMLRELAPVEGLATWFRAGDDQALAAGVVSLCRDTRSMRAMGERAWKHAVDHFSIGRFIHDYCKDI